MYVSTDKFYEVFPEYGEDISRVQVVRWDDSEGGYYTLDVEYFGGTHESFVLFQDDADALGLNLTCHA